MGGGTTSENKFWLKVCVGISFALNLCLLFYFKYFEFALANLNRIFRATGFQMSIPKFDILLPVGISFYIFQALGYTVDVYRREIKAEKNFLRYALFVSFFPQLVAGPIERSKNLLKQVNKPTYFNVENARAGLLTMAYGLFMKVVVADRLAGIIDPVFNEWSEQSGMNLLVATILFAIQIYCDFEGYSQLAIGCARVLGFHINQNFDTPYLCTSVKGFWKRWHMSLTSWFRDYLYIPLGGNRKGTFKKCINIIIVFLVSGLWHGASWHYVIWGGINGIYNVIEDITSETRKKIYNTFRIDTDAFLWKCFCGLISFILIDITWLFFRAPGTQEAITIFIKICCDFRLKYFFSDNFYLLFGSTKAFAMIIISCIIVFIIDILRRKKIDIIMKILNQQIIYRWIIYFAVIFIILLWGAYGSGYEQTQFIYFQF